MQKFNINRCDRDKKNFKDYYFMKIYFKNKFIVMFLLFLRPNYTNFITIEPLSK